MGSVQVGDVGAPEDGFIRYYAGKEGGGFGDGLRWNSGTWVLQRLETVAPKRGNVKSQPYDATKA